MNTAVNSKPLRRVPLVIAALVLLSVIAYLIYSLTVQAQLPTRETPSVSIAPDVSVIELLPADYQAQITAYGAVVPQYALTLTAKVSGYVANLSPDFKTGAVVSAGDVLLELEASDYERALASAQETLAAARLTLLEEQRQAVQAQAEWQSAGLAGEPDSDLVLRQPYVDAAQASVDSAAAAVDSAQIDLAQTRITSPFNATVIERLVAPGSYVQTGTQIATLYSSDRVEITLALSGQDWTKLPPASELLDSRWPVHLQDIESGKTWTGYIDRVEQHLDSTTRQRAVVVAVDSPLAQSTALLPGSFVNATIPGRSVDDLWRLPSSALSQRGEIWYVKDDNTLANFTATVSFSEGEQIYVVAPASLAHAPQRILLHPLSGYLAGMHVKPITPATGTVAVQDPAEADNNG